MLWLREDPPEFSGMHPWNSKFNRRCWYLNNRKSLVRKCDNQHCWNRSSRLFMYSSGYHPSIYFNHVHRANIYTNPQRWYLRKPRTLRLLIGEKLFIAVAGLVTRPVGALIGWFARGGWSRLRHRKPKSRFGSMVLALRLSPTIRYTTSISARYFSSMTATTIVLPHEEIEQLWFGGLDLKPGCQPSTDAIKRWFRKDPEFDTSCK